jgi:hypothetical protein
MALGAVGDRESWMRLDKSDPRLGELRHLHEATGGWWWRNDKLNGGWGGKEFLPTEEWEKVYALCVDDRDRAIWAVIGVQRTGRRRCDGQAFQAEAVNSTHPTPFETLKIKNEFWETFSQQLAQVSPPVALLSKTLVFEKQIQCASLLNFARVADLSSR